MPCTSSSASSSSRLHRRCVPITLGMPDTPDDPHHVEKALATLYTNVGSRFGSPDKIGLRLFLMEADISELELVPALPPVELAITYDSLQEDIEAREREVSELETAIAELRSCVHIF